MDWSFLMTWWWWAAAVLGVAATSPRARLVAKRVRGGGLLEQRPRLLQTWCLVVPFALLLTVLVVVRDFGAGLGLVGVYVVGFAVLCRWWIARAR
jgi:hypothetical protein